MTTAKERKAKADELIAEIEKLTGRPAESKNPRYLAQRLADLKRRAADGEDVRRQPEHATPLSFSVPLAAFEEFGKIMRAEKLSTSELGRKALAEWARREGHKKLAAALAGDP
jgi:hypothetical protein